MEYHHLLWTSVTFTSPMMALLDSCHIGTRPFLIWCRCPLLPLFLFMILSLLPFCTLPCLLCPPFPLFLLTLFPLPLLCLLFHHLHEMISMTTRRVLILSGWEVRGRQSTVRMCGCTTNSVRPTPASTDLSDFVESISLLVFGTGMPGLAGCRVG
ncbi:hypothetical protein EV361DRAFT_60769 [Lentinula raphanica]|nr:hypothetical protein EV361DRAFT_60769 [Lentinula raphanica]